MQKGKRGLNSCELVLIIDPLQETAGFVANNPEKRRRNEYCLESKSIYQPGCNFGGNKTRKAE